VGHKYKKRNVVVFDIEDYITEELKDRRFIINEAGRIVCGKIPKSGDITIMLSKNGGMEIGITKTPGRSCHKRIFNKWLTEAQKKVLHSLTK